MKKTIALVFMLAYSNLMISQIPKGVKTPRVTTIINPAADVKSILQDNWSFENRLTSWNAEGTAFANQPTVGGISAKKYDIKLTCRNGSTARTVETNWNPGYSGNSWVSTGENKPLATSPLQENFELNTVGTLVSKEFVLSKEYITYLLAGKSSEKKCSVDILVLDDGTISKSDTVRRLDGPSTVVGGRPLSLGQSVIYSFPSVAYGGKNYIVISSSVNNIIWQNDAIYNSSAIGLNSVRLKRVGSKIPIKYFGKKAIIRIVDNDANGFIAIDDFKFENSVSETAATQELTTAGCPVPLQGIVDMHTHPMAHLGFGGKVLHGAPDEQTLMLAGSIYRGSDVLNGSNCKDSLRPGSIDVALSRCDAIHGGWEGSNNCGDIIRSAVVGKLDQVYKYFGFKNDGYPNFDYWPHQTTVTHQQMWHQWIKRAYDGGLRVMVGLAVHNRLITQIAKGQQYIDDKSSADLQIREMIAFVGRHNDFMEVAYTPNDLIRINRANKLAVIIGVEIDDIGNFAYNNAYNGTPVTIENVRPELRRLYDLGVRYAFPIHMSNNLFGGTAVNRDLFALISKHYTNSYVSLENSCTENLRFQLTKYNPDFTANIGLEIREVGHIVDNQPTYAPPSAGCGHANALGLSELGKQTMQEMMRIGFIIDIDHMSRKSMRDAIEESKKFRNYPLNTGHNGIGEAGSERNLTRDLVDSIAKTGGMIGIGSVDALPRDFVNNFLNVASRMGYKNVAIGTDVNGMEPLPKATPGLNSAEFYRDFPLEKCRTGNQTWDYTNTSTPFIPTGNGGVAHYGLMPEFFKDVSLQRDGTRVKNMLNLSADDFLIMWQKCITTATTR